VPNGSCGVASASAPCRPIWRAERGFSGVEQHLGMHLAVWRRRHRACGWYPRARWMRQPRARLRGGRVRRCGGGGLWRCGGRLEVAAALLLALFLFFQRTYPSYCSFDMGLLAFLTSPASVSSMICKRVP
jgi:hypothetical protein